MKGEEEEEDREPLNPLTTQPKISLNSIMGLTRLHSLKWKAP